MRTVRSAFLIALVVGTGIAVGVWTASLVHSCPAFCMFGEPVFAAWQSCLLGGLAAAIALVVAGALDRAFIPGSVQGLRKASHFLFEDLSRRQVR